MPTAVIFFFARSARITSFAIDLINEGDDRNIVIAGTEPDAMTGAIKSSERHDQDVGVD